MHISEVMQEYLEELETTCANYQATVTDGGSFHAQGNE